MQHADNTIAYYLPNLTGNRRDRPACVNLQFVSKIKLRYEKHECHTPSIADYLCDQEPTRESQIKGIDDESLLVTSSNSSKRTRFNTTDFKLCPQGHFTHNFLPCDPLNACTEKHSASCSDPSFMCANDVQRAPYTVVCDFRPDCSDSSDELFCTYLPCDNTRHYECHSGQCVAITALCDDVPDCVDESDEIQCTEEVKYSTKSIPGPAVVRFNGANLVQLIPLNGTNSSLSTSCPVAHYQCPGSGYCLPVFTRCNGVHDCQGGPDEAGCDHYTCPGYYHCRASRVCVTHSEMCDGFPHCPLHDDELLCDVTCPTECTCRGLAFDCHRLFQVANFPSLRYLDASGSGLRPADVANNTMLVYLSLANCHLRELQHLSLVNLNIMDISDNHLTDVTDQHLSGLPNLRHLSLAGNPLTSVFTPRDDPPVLSTRLHGLDLSRVAMSQFHMSALSPFPNLQLLNLTDCGVVTLVSDSFKIPASLQVFDARGCPLTDFPANLLQGLDQLRQVRADNYKLCCPLTLPSGFNPTDCEAPSDEVSSCDNLLHSHIYRVFLASFSSLALLGNLTAFVARGILGKVKNGFDIFTVTLCVSDFLMGVYLAIIGVADRVYLGSYLWNDVSWRRSATCHIAGFLCMTSTEVSALVVCLITLDRLLVLRFPFSRVRFSKRSGALASGAVWVVGVVLALIPLLPPTAHWGFYSLSGICMPLPITRKEFAGHTYSFSLLIVFNFVLFVLVAVGQLLIYLSVQRNSLQQVYSDTKRSSKEQRLARRLITIAVSDFLCWFPIGLLGILSSSGMSVSGDVNVAMAIFVLPLNSAINPFLYTVNRLMEKRQIKREQRLMQQLAARMKQQATLAQVS